MKENNVQIQKIQKTSKVALVVTNIIKWFGIVSMILCLLAGITILVMQDSFNEEMNAAMESDDIETIMIAEFIEADELISLGNDGNYALVLGVYMLVVGVILAEMSVLFHFIGRVFMTLRESYSPFVPKVIKQLKVTFILLTLLSMSSGLGIGAIVGLALWCVFHIFQYGCELQREADETL